MDPFSKKPIKAIIFSVSIGSGHDSVAKALAERLLLDSPGSEVRIIDTFKYINRVLHTAVYGSYMETLRLTPKVWGYIYDQAESGEHLIDLGQMMSQVLSYKLQQLLKEMKPDVIIATHAFPAGMLGTLRQKGKITQPLGAVVTDFHVHSFWIHQGVDVYFIPFADLDHRLLKEGIRADRIQAVGIPIGNQYSQAINTQEIRAKLGLLDQPTILVAGGGLGLGRIELIVKDLLKKSDFQVLVVAGKNKRLFRTLFKMESQRLKAYGFVENMAEVIAAADLVISKPGGVTTAEVLALKKPLVIYSCLPGQEDRNTDYLLNKGAAIKVKKVEDLLTEIKSLWNNPLRLRHLRETAEHIGAPFSSRMVWERLYQGLSEGPCGRSWD